MNPEGNSIKDGSSDKPPDELVVLRNGFGGTLGLLEIVDIVLVIIQSGVGKIAIWRKTTMKKHDCINMNIFTKERVFIDASRKYLIVS